MKNGVFILLLFLFVASDAFCSNTLSVIASGDWYKMHIRQDGIYRITYSGLRQLGISNPENVRIYGSGGAMLPEISETNAGDNDLQEIPILMVTGSDGVFNDGDYILFYGQGPVMWRYEQEEQKFTHTLHLYDNQSCYFITSEVGGKRITTEAPPQSEVTHEVTSFDDRHYHEAELVNVIKSGRNWYGELFHTTTTTYTFPFNVPDIDLSVPVYLDAAFIAASATPAILEVSYEGNPITQKVLPAIAGQQFATETIFRTSFNALAGNIPVTLTLNQSGNSTSRGWLDYLRVQMRRKLNMTQPQLLFRDTYSVGERQTARFQLTGTSENTMVWDITNLHHPTQISTSRNGNNLTFTVASDELREFVAFDMVSGLLTPEFPEDKVVANQNLHGIIDVDMVIVTHPDFLEASQQLAGLHWEKDGLTTSIVTTQQVYNEFSSGMQDPAAIRNFVKQVYEKSSERKLKYLLLMGAGSYDNKSNDKASYNTNYVVTYQSENSIHKTNSYVSDDFFGILDDGASILTGSLQIGIGRLPVQTPAQGQDMVDKIRRYMDTQVQGDWPNLIGLLADDGDAHEHALQSDRLAKYVAGYHPQYTINKLYFDAFPQVVTADGHRYPEVVTSLDNMLNRGCLLVNYMGHGNETGLSDERVINTTSISQWTNKIYPLFVVATCDFGRYDDYAKVTAGENVVLSPSGGGIALVTSTRLVYSNLNYELNDRFFRALFTHPPTGTEHRLGDILRLAKNSAGASVNKLCFTLLGDPALKPPVPSNIVRTLSINGKPVGEPQDTLKANSRVTIRGDIADMSGQMLTGFNGVVHLSLFDKARETETLDNEGTGPMTYTTQVSSLYKGKVSVTNGAFECSFILPRDINYQYGFGKITYYAYAENDAASGAYTEIIVGGAGLPVDDTKGPDIRLFINDTLFRDGGITNQHPRLVAHLTDENGINTGGEGIGHDITAVLSDDPSVIYVLNPYYEAALDNYRKGTLTYQFSNLPEGNYELTLVAWDVANNASQETIRFQVTSSQHLKISHLYNYPNPFSDHTYIYFEYNLPNESVDVTLQIFDQSGRQLHSVSQSLYSEGYTSGQFGWDGCDANRNRMRNGIYIYRVTLRSKTGQKVWDASKMMLVK